MADEVKGKARPLGASPRDHQRHARRPGGLDGGSRPGVQPSPWDSSPVRQLLGPFSLLHGARPTGEAAAGRHGGVTDRFVSTRLGSFRLDYISKLLALGADCSKFKDT